MIEALFSFWRSEPRTARSLVCRPLVRSSRFWTKSAALDASHWHEESPKRRAGQYFRLGPSSRYGACHSSATAHRPCGTSSHRRRHRCRHSKSVRHMSKRPIQPVDVLDRAASLVDTGTLDTKGVHNLRLLNESRFVDLVQTMVQDSLEELIGQIPIDETPRPDAPHDERLSESLRSPLGSFAHQARCRHPASRTPCRQARTDAPATRDGAAERRAQESCCRARRRRG